jgi:hypothetical protein
VPTPCPTAREMDASRAGLKAELKAWEKSFSKEHNRAPTPADIKADAVICTCHLLDPLTKLTT